MSKKVIPSKVVILETDPHGEHELRLAVGGDNETLHNSIFKLSQVGQKEVFFTGEELTSLSLQWLAYVERERIRRGGK